MLEKSMHVGINYRGDECNINEKINFFTLSNSWTRNIKLLDQTYCMLVCTCTSFAVLYALSLINLAFMIKFDEVESNK